MKEPVLIDKAKPGTGITVGTSHMLLIMLIDNQLYSTGNNLIIRVDYLQVIQPHQPCCKT